MCQELDPVYQGKHRRAPPKAILSNHGFSLFSQRIASTVPPAAGSTYYP